MKKKIYTLLLMCTLALTAWSQEMAHVLIVELANGTSTRIAVTDRPVINHSGNEVTIKSDWLSATYNINEVKKYRFEVQDITGIEEIEETKQLTIVYTDGETVRISGIEENTKIALYSIDGRKLSADVTSGDNHVIVNLRELPKGIYIVSVNGMQSFKVVRR